VVEYWYVSVDSRVGPWTLEGTEAGLTRVFMPHEPAPSATRNVSTSLDRAADQLDEYFRRRRTTFDVTFAPVAATDFQRDVWDAVTSLPYGTVATYADIATLTGRPAAARAVGNAVHVNPRPPFVPCHRVVAANGLGGYGGGEDVKRFLLNLEGVSISS
jgi:methylated-DNA-[protein]-cysteine S-methyltransferase